MSFETPVSSYSILIAEEIPGICSSISEIFRNEPYRVVMASNGNDAFAKANAQHFDLVITGIGMPGMDGIELLNTLRKRKPDLPVIVIGREAEIDTVYLRCATMLGACGTFRHPVESPALLNHVQMVIRKSRLQPPSHKSEP